MQPLVKILTIRDGGLEPKRSDRPVTPFPRETTRRPGHDRADGTSGTMTEGSSQLFRSPPSSGALPADRPRQHRHPTVTALCPTRTHDVVNQVPQSPDGEKAAQGEQQSVPGQRGDLRGGLEKESLTALTPLSPHRGTPEVTEELPVPSQCRRMAGTCLGRVRSAPAYREGLC